MRVTHSIPFRRPVIAATLLALLATAAPSFADTSLPSGTVIPIRMKTTVSSATSRPEDAVLAVVRQPVYRRGRVVIPAGSELRGHVVTARRSGRVKGRAYLAVRFTEIEIDGRRYPVGARALAQEAPGTGRRDAGVIAGGALGGAVVGAAADGKKGAGKGALIGGAAGTGVVLATRGKEVTFPAGGRYRVRLSRTLSLD
jgi:hypothetical protein